MIDYEFKEVTNFDQLERDAPEVASQVLSLPLAKIFGASESELDGDNLKCWSS